MPSSIVPRHMILTTTGEPAAVLDCDGETLRVYRKQEWDRHKSNAAPLAALSPDETLVLARFLRELEDGATGRHRARRRWRWAVLAIVSPLLACVLYVLSLGPAVWLYDRSPGPVRAALEFVYYPLEELATGDGPAEVFLEWYMDLWEGRE